MSDSNSNSDSDIQCQSCNKDVYSDELVYKCVRCDFYFHDHCVGLEDVPRSCVRDEYLCPECIRNDESNIKTHYKVPLTLPEKAIDEVIELAVGGLLTDGAHHKQLCLEQILEKILGKEEFTKMMINYKIDGYSWEMGC